MLSLLNCCFNSFWVYCPLVQCIPKDRQFFLGHPVHMLKVIDI